MLVNTCLADNLSTLSTFNWGKLQLLNVDFFVYIKLSTFLCQKAVSPCISSLSYVFHKMRFSWNSFLSTLSTLSFDKIPQFCPHRKIAFFTEKVVIHQVIHIIHILFPSFSAFPRQFFFIRFFVYLS